MAARTTTKSAQLARRRTPRAADSDRYVILPIDQVKDDPRNENVHPDTQIVLLRASIRCYGQQEDILIDRKHVCIGGHGIKLAMKLEGCQTISCKYSNLEGAKRAGYRSTTNQLARLSFFDQTLYEKNVKAVAKEMGAEFDPAWLGLEAAEWEAILKGHDWHGKAIDPTAIGEYDPASETFLIKIENVKAADKEPVLSLVNRALKRTDYEAHAF